MKKIWKFPLQIIQGEQAITAPSDFTVTHIDMQGPQLFLWVLVDPDSIIVEHRFEVYGTGHEIDRDRKLLATVVDPPHYVWHVFEVLS